MELVDWEPFKERYTGSAVWLVCGGPSVRGFDFSRLSGTVAAINEIGCDIPNLDIWIGNDRLPEYPVDFWQSECQKFVRAEQGTLPNQEIKNLHRFKSSQQSISGSLKIREDLYFNPDRVMWGAPAISSEGKATVKKSAMLMAFGVLYRMGFSEVRLLGCDWSQSIDEPYGHSHKEMDETAVRKGNEQFAFMEQWFRQLLPMFTARHFRIMNCTDGGNLELFERADWRDITLAPQIPAY